MLNIGIIGCGCHARWAIIPAMLNSGCCKLSAMADPDPASMDEVKAPGIHKYRHASDMFAKERLDAVCIATPVEAHRDMTVLALKAGCHVCCEKPMAVNKRECRLMIDAALKADRILAIDFESRFYPGYQQVQRWIAEGHLGQVRAVHVDSMWDGHKATGPLSARRKGFLDRSGCLDCGVHKLDIIRFICGGGQWQDVRAIGAWFDEDVRFPPHIGVQGRLDTGAMVTLNESFAFGAYMKQRPAYVNVAVVGTRGVVVLENVKDQPPVFRLTSDSLNATAPLDETDHAVTIVYLLQELDAAIHGGPGPFHFARGEDGLAAQVALDAANRDAVKGCCGKRMAHRAKRRG